MRSMAFRLSNRIPKMAPTLIRNRFESGSKGHWKRLWMRIALPSPRGRRSAFPETAWFSHARQSCTKLWSAGIHVRYPRCGSVFVSNRWSFPQRSTFIVASESFGPLIQRILVQRMSRHCPLDVLELSNGCLVEFPWMSMTFENPHSNVHKFRIIGS